MTMKKKLTRWVAAATAVATIATLAACSADDGGESADESVTLRFNWWGSDVRYTLTREVLDLFEEEYPNITVETEFAPFGDYFDKLSTSAAAGDLPDVMQLTDPYVYSYIDNGQLLDLTDVSDVLATNGFSENSLSGVTVDGALYGVPNGEVSFAFFANPDLFAQAGVEVPDDDTWTWDDYIETAAEISAALPGVNGSQITFDEQQFTAFVRQRGADLWLQDGSDIGFDSDDAEAWFDLLVEMRDSGGFPSPEAAVESIGLSVEQSPIAVGTSAMQPFAIGQLVAAESASGVEFDLLRFPGESENEVGQYTKSGAYYSIASNSEHPKEAAALIDFLVNSEEAGAITKFDRGVPANASVLDSLADSLTPVEARVVEFLDRIEASDPKPFPKQNVNAGPALVEIFNRLQQEVLFDRMTPERAGQQLVDEITSNL